MKKMVTMATVLVVLLLMGVLPVAYAADSDGAPSVSGVVIDEDPETNVRAGPGTGYSIIGTVPQGSSVEITGYSGTWYKIKYLGRTNGYVSQKLVSISSYAGKICDTTPTNVRKGPGTKYDTIGQLSNGTSVEVVGSSGNWSIIWYDGGLGYVYTPLISTSDSTNGSTSSTDSASSTGTTASNRFDTVGTADEYVSKIVVDKSDHLLVAYSASGETLLQCACSTAKTGYSTPNGTYRVTLVSSKDYTRTSESGTIRTYDSDSPSNPFYIYIKCRNVETNKIQYIHGTGGGWLKVGGNYSNGCIRVSDSDLIELISELPRKSTNSSSTVWIDSGVTLVIQD